MIPLVLVGVAAWLVMTRDSEPQGAPEPRAALTTGTDAPRVDLDDVPASLVAASDRDVAIGPPTDSSSPSAEDRPNLLRFELVDVEGRPAEIDVDVEYRIRFSDSPRTLAPTHFLARGPRVERDLPPSFVPQSGREVEVVARSAGQRGDGLVSTSRATETAWPRIVLHPTTTVRGLLVDAHGSPVEGVPILLRDDTPGKEAHSRVLTDAGGAFVIDALPDRANRLFVGDPVYPWAPIVAVDAKNGPFVLEPIRVELFGASFRVQRPDGSPASGARLEGIGLDGGRFALEVDEDGRATVSTLLRGRWRVNASEAIHGRASRAVQIPLANDEPVLILLPR